MQRKGAFSLKDTLNTMSCTLGRAIMSTDVRPLLLLKRKKMHSTFKVRLLGIEFFFVLF